MGWKLCPNSNELFSVSRVHRTDKAVQCTHVLCNRSCSHIARVPCKLLMLLIGLSMLYLIQSCSSPIQSVTWWQKLWSRDLHLDPTVTSLVAALLVCWMSAACTGSFLAWFIPSFVLVRSYSRTTNRSSGYIHSPMARGSFQSVVAACWLCQCKDVTTTVHILALYMLKHNCWHQ